MGHFAGPKDSLGGRREDDKGTNLQTNPFRLTVLPAIFKPDSYRVIHYRKTLRGFRPGRVLYQQGHYYPFVFGFTVVVGFTSTGFFSPLVTEASLIAS
mgnify:CR=1 FL=1